MTTHVQVDTAAARALYHVVSVLASRGTSSPIRAAMLTNQRAVLLWQSSRAPKCVLTCHYMRQHIVKWFVVQRERLFLCGLVVVLVIVECVCLRLSAGL